MLPPLHVPELIKPGKSTHPSETSNDVLKNEATKLIVFNVYLKAHCISPDKSSESKGTNCHLIANCCCESSL